MDTWHSVMDTWHSVRYYDSSHSVLYLSTGTLSQNEAGILIKCGRGGTEKKKLKKKHVPREIFGK